MSKFKNIIILMDIVMEEKNSFDLFISYRSKDKEFAKKLAKSIETENYGERKLKVFLDQWDIKPGENIVSCIEEGLLNSRYIALILSPEYLEGDWAKAEKDAAIFQDPSGRLGKVIPIMYKKCKLPPLLGYRRYIDFTSKSNYISGLSLLKTMLKNEPLLRDENKLKITQKMNYSELEYQQLNCLKADEINENIYPNIFKLTKIPDIWSAPTTFRTRKQIFRYYGNNFVPSYILLNKRLYTFSNLTNPDNPFIGVIEEYDIHHERYQNWIKDDIKANNLIWLLNDCVRAHAHQFRLSYYKSGKKYYYKSGTLKENGFKAFSKGKGKEMILEYPKAFHGRGYFAHRGVNIKFILISEKPYMWIETGWVFTYDGYKPIEGKKRSVLNTRFMSNQRTFANFNEIRFWLWFLATDGKKIQFDTGQDFIEVDTEPIRIQITEGIFDDQKSLSPTGHPPQLIFDDWDEISIPLDKIDDDFDDEDDGGDTSGYFF